MRAVCAIMPLSCAVALYGCSTAPAMGAILRQRRSPQSCEQALAVG